jgi:curved DNA-binding protein CbpA
MTDDLYAILGVGRAADESEIRSAHRRLVRKYHPDAGVGSSEERFRKIQDAYEVLSDPARRKEYDDSRLPLRVRTSREPGTFANHLDLRTLRRRAPEPEPMIGRGGGGRSYLFLDLLILLREQDPFL